MSSVKAKVYLINYTHNPEAIIAASARLCYSDSTIEEIVDNVNSKDNSSFISRLVSFGHMSPFEHASFTFGIEGVSRSLLAQITRHRIASFSVQSQRYISAKNDEVFNFITPPSIEALGETEVKRYEEQMKTMQTWYNEWQKKLGGPKESSNEDARFVLPNAAETKIIFTMNTREMLHFLSLRTCNRAQWEIRDVAWEMLKILDNKFPSLFSSAGPSCVRGACQEGKMTCGKIKQVREFRRNINAQEKE